MKKLPGNKWKKKQEKLRKNSKQRKLKKNGYLETKKLRKHLRKREPNRRLKPPRKLLRLLRENKSDWRLKKKLKRHKKTRMPR